MEIQIPSPDKQNVEEKFFQNHRSNTTEEAALVNFLKNINENSPFVELAAKRIGFPRWDKVIKRPGGSLIGGYKTNSVRNNNKPQSANSRYDIYYVPFARDSQNYVNAAMVITASTTDTSFEYRCDWQYKNRLNGSNNQSENARKYATFFMKLDNAVFGHTSFKITDKAIFPVKDTSEPNQVVVVFKTASLQNIVVNAYNSVCQDIQVDFNYCPWIALGFDCAGPGGTCDHCGSCPSVTKVYTNCWDEWEEDGAGSNSGGGGGSSGGSAPPDSPCGGGSQPPQDPPMIMSTKSPVAEVRSNFVMGCGPGWEPTGPGFGQGHVAPCITAQRAALKLKILFDSSGAAAKLATIQNLSAETLEKGFHIMESIRINPFDINDTTGHGYSSGNVLTGSDTSINATASYNPNTQAIAGFLHTHPPKGYAAQSARDIYTLIASQFEAKSRVKGNFVASADGSVYGLTITDATQASQFYNNMSQDLNGVNWNMNSDIGKAFSEALNSFTKLYKNNPNATNLSYEMAMAAVLNRFNSGVTLCKRDATGNFIPLVVRTDIQTSSNGRRTTTTYTRDCN